MDKPTHTVLIVDDDAKVLDAFDLLFEGKYRLLTARTAAETLQCLQKEPVELIFLDITLPDENGLTLLQKIKQEYGEIDVVMVTANIDAKVAVQAMRLGARDYVMKPFDIDEVLIIADRIFQGQQLLSEVSYLRDLQDPMKSNPIVGESQALKEVFEIVKKVRDNDSTILLVGESGTGKELVARAIHFSGVYRQKPFIPVNCGAIPENLVESELFGHERGSFTGATQKKIGKFELANQGTIFLDEVGNLRLDTQAKLLRALQEQEVERVGGSYPIPVKVRVISATNIDLKKAVSEGKFREDLYYRLNVVQVTLPLLRERAEDIPILANHYLNYYATRFRKKVKGVTPEAMDCLVKYSWPGNVRELRNIIERVVALTNKTMIDPKELPLDLLLSDDLKNIKVSQNGLSLKDARDLFETQYILNVLESTGWNQSRAAELMGVHRNTLINKMHELNIKTPS